MKKGLIELLAEKKFEVDKVVPLTEERLLGFLEEVFINRKPGNLDLQYSIEIIEDTDTFSAKFKVGDKVFTTGKQGLKDRLPFFKFSKVVYNGRELNETEKKTLTKIIKNDKN